MIKGKKSMWLLIASVLVILGIVIVILTACSSNWDITKFDTKKYEIKEYVICDGFNNILINCDDADITIKKANDGINKIVCNETKRSTYRVEIIGENAEINLVDERRWYDYISIFSFNKKFITVYLCDTEYESLNIEVKTGDILINSDFTFGDVQINGRTGDIKMYASASSLKAKISTGEIDIANAEFGSIELLGTTGDINLESINCSGDIYAEIDTSDIEVENVTCHSLNLKGGTGDVEISDISIDELSVTISTGDIELLDAVAGSISLNTTSGNVHVENTKSTVFSSDANTGSIEMDSLISESINVTRSTGDVEFELCDANDIIITTGTGSVTGSLLSGKTFITKTDTGKVRVPENTPNGKCNITTSAGKIIITVAK